MPAPALGPFDFPGEDEERSPGERERGRETIPRCVSTKLHRRPCRPSGRPRTTRRILAARKAARVARVTSDVDHQSRTGDTRFSEAAARALSSVHARCCTEFSPKSRACNPGNCIAPSVEYRTRISRPSEGCILKYLYFSVCKAAPALIFLRLRALTRKGACCGRGAINRRSEASLSFRQRDPAKSD